MTKKTTLGAHSITVRRDFADELAVRLTSGTTSEGNAAFVREETAELAARVVDQGPHYAVQLSPEGLEAFIAAL
ncbi:MAG: hypothetical protein INH41_11215 [Myxococcaceae bacterium]|jgi:hypothetical protein|nr:hypothetical protein [Myxococcaceae bacterium]MCA3012950.1 hypothetical protein [Myxococcaceae bacterium]